MSDEKKNGAPVFQIIRTYTPEPAGRFEYFSALLDW
jgi:hypothetical protein